MTSSDRSFVACLPLMPAALGGCLLGVALWSHWPNLTAMYSSWINDPQYSHGYLVPVFSIVLLWLRSAWLAGVTWKADLRGLVWFAAAVALRLSNSFTYGVDWLDSVAFVLSVVGIVHLLGGWPALKWAGPAAGFLIFMAPLPHRVERSIGAPLQTLATEASAFFLQMLGLPAITEGNTIILYDIRLGVAEACNGLAMLLVFIALSVAFAAVVKRPWLDRAILVASSIPIALIVNVIRITATGALHVWIDQKTADLVFHDLAGWLMIPLALLLLWVEAKFLTYVWLERPADGVGAASGDASPVGRSRSEESNLSLIPGIRPANPTRVTT